MIIYKFNTLLKVTLVSLIALMSLQSAWGKDVNILQGNVRFKLNIQGHGVKYFVSVNDVIVFKQYNSDTQDNLELPINHWMHPEQSQFRVWAGDAKGNKFPSGASVKLTLVIEDRDSGASYKLPIIELNGNEVYDHKTLNTVLKTGRYHLAANNKVEFGKGEIDLKSVIKNEYSSKDTFIYSRQVSVPNQLPLWAFFNSDPLPEYQSLSDEDMSESINELFVAYKEIQDALEKGDVDSIMPLFAERNKELDIAFGYDSGEMERLLREYIQKAIDDPNWKLRKRTANQVGIYREKNKKIVSLMRSKFTDILGFVNKNNLFYSLTIKFRRENGEWIITR
ncbi:hypothetical protein [Psychromonas sp. SP041]|uniref:hypothetical protein n=1 Tax=Psychromonas sp. SP041 TaxID=1365007 RepID=UPI0003F6962C|nr:hypothetical protein [Psychromonas sp. SP041]